MYKEEAEEEVGMVQTARGVPVEGEGVREIYSQREWYAHTHHYIPT